MTQGERIEEIREQTRAQLAHQQGGECEHISRLRDYLHNYDLVIQIPFVSVKSSDPRKYDMQVMCGKCGGKVIVTSPLGGRGSR